MVGHADLTKEGVDFVKRHRHPLLRLAFIGPIVRYRRAYCRVGIPREWLGTSQTEFIGADGEQHPDPSDASAVLIARRILPSAREEVIQTRARWSKGSLARGCDRLPGGRGLDGGKDESKGAPKR